jgi:hypothetical protein
VVTPGGCQTTPAASSRDDRQRGHSDVRRPAHARAGFSVFRREQFLFIEFEKMTADPQAAIDVVHDFLGLPPHRLPDFPKLNQGGEYTPMAPATRAHLIEYFRPYNARVRELTGLECAWDR